MEQAKLQRQHEAVTGAIFLAYLREQQEQDGSTIKPTLRQVSGVLGIRISKLAAAMKQLQPFLQVNNYSKSSGAITSVAGLVKTILPTVVLHDPFMPEVDVTDRVTSLTEKIISLVQRKTTHSVEPNLIAISAHFLAWQSCFFYQIAYHGSIPIDQLKKPCKLPTLEEHLELLKLDHSMRLPVRKSYSYLVSELSELLDKMTWVVKKGRHRPRNQIPEHLGAILDFQEVVCDVLSEEAEVKRCNQIYIQPAIPRGKKFIKVKLQLESFITASQLQLIYCMWHFSCGTFTPLNLLSESLSNSFVSFARVDRRRGSCFKCAGTQ